MSQFDEVSNIANPTLDAELAMSMTVNAKLPKTPQRHSPAAGAPDFALDSLDNKIPIGEIEPPIPAGFPDQMANGEESFKAPQCERRLHQMVTAAQKSSSPEIRTDAVPSMIRPAFAPTRVFALTKTFELTAM